LPRLIIPAEKIAQKCNIALNLLLKKCRNESRVFKANSMKKNSNIPSSLLHAHKIYPSMTRIKKTPLATANRLVL
jgi:hypothetical protein